MRTLGILGSMAVEGPLLKWVAEHRKHHQHSDHEDDPHSPHLHGTAWWSSSCAGLWHAHIGWLFDPRRPGPRTATSATSSATAAVAVISRLFALWVGRSACSSRPLLGGLLTWSWTGVLLGFLWGGLVRVFLVHHVTWSINSVCHLWGSRPFRSDDESRNNVLFGVLAMGEGWHNNHHAFPTSARHGLRWWQLDVSYLVIRLLGLLHLAWDIRVPDEKAIASHRNTATPA